MSRGFTLLEVIVSLLLLQIGVVGALGTLALASRTLAEAQQTERAVTEAEGVLDSLAGVAGAVSGARAVPGGTIEWSVDGSGVVALRAARDDGRVWVEVTSALPPR